MIYEPIMAVNYFTRSLTISSASSLSRRLAWRHCQGAEQTVSMFSGSSELWNGHTINTSLHTVHLQKHSSVKTLKEKKTWE